MAQPASRAEAPPPRERRRSLSDYLLKGVFVLVEVAVRVCVDVFFSQWVSLRERSARFTGGGAQLSYSSESEPGWLSARTSKAAETKGFT